jgi:hypothetical protein
MAVALDLHYGFKYEPLTGISSDIHPWGYDRRGEMIAALETSNQFWRICKNESVEASKAYSMFSFVLMKAKKAMWIIEAHLGNDPGVPNESSGQTNVEFPNERNGADIMDTLPDFDEVRYIF